MLSLRILDRYVTAELSGPFTFGLSTFTLIFCATQLLAISRLVADEHVPLGAAIAFFFWQMPSFMVLVIPMAMLLGVLLAMQRLSNESEITALMAGGISLLRIVAPLLVTGIVASFVVLALQEGIVPYANDRASDIRDDVARHGAAFSGGQRTIVTGVPGGGQQLTYYNGFDMLTQTLYGVTVIKYDSQGRADLEVFSKRAKYDISSWTFFDADEYRFNADGTTYYSQAPEQRIDIGERPSEIELRLHSDNPDNLSRAQLHEILTSPRTTAAELPALRMTYEEKLARPFAAFVLTLLAVPFGLRPARGGGTGFGFGIAVAMGFVYFVVMSFSSAVFRSLGGGEAVAVIGAWTPNALFTAIGALLLARVNR